MLAILFLQIFLKATPATEVFPYSTRTRNYSGWNSTIQGDVGALGMGGATVAIPSSISAAQINPAGFAMVTASISAQVLSNTINDEHIQKNINRDNNNQWGLGVNPSPWGFGILYYSPTIESGNYQSPTTHQNLDTTISVRELRIAVAHAFFENKLSLGMSLGVAKAVRELGPYSYNSIDLDFEVGALYRLENHLILGASFIPQNTIGASTDVYTQTDMPGFNQPIITPAQLTAGIGWVPNRFFRAGFSLTYISSISNTALLADQNKMVGTSSVFEPRLGGNYVFVDYKNFKMEFAMGTYFEPSRISGESNRLHATMGLEIEPWFMNGGFGVDVADAYKNVLVSISVDIVRVARLIEIIPKDPVPPYQGVLPPPFLVQPEGLPAGITEGEKSDVTPPSLQDAGKIIMDIPTRIKEKISPKSVGKKKRKVKKKPEAHSTGEN